MLFAFMYDCLQWSLGPNMIILGHNVFFDITVRCIGALDLLYSSRSKEMPQTVVIFYLLSSLVPGSISRLNVYIVVFTKIFLSLG